MANRKAPRETVTCATCGEQRQVTVSYFLRNRTGTFFCSVACKKDYKGVIPRYAGRKEKVPVSCAVEGCERTKDVWPSHYQTNKTGRFFCSEEHRRLAGSKPRRKAMLTCQWEPCGKEFYPTSQKHDRFCSLECTLNWQRRNRVAVICPGCGKERFISQSDFKNGVRYHRECWYIARTKTGTGRWHNGKPVRKDKKGYLLVWEPNHPDAHSKGWMLEHRLVMEKVLGRRLLPEEQVHHLREDSKDDNTPDNLYVTGAAEHTRITVGERGERWRAQQRRIGELEAELARLRGGTEA